MGKNKFDLFTFQMGTLPFQQLDLFDAPLSKDDLMQKKNEIFSGIFKNELIFFHRLFKLNYKIEFEDEDFILIRLANRKTVNVEKQFHRESFESEPSCLVAINNNPSIQTIAIESDITSFGNSFTVVRIIEKAFEKSLNKSNLKIKIHPQFEEKDFWDLLDRYESQVESLKFEFEYPNLPRVNRYLSDELKATSKQLNSEKTKVEFTAGDNKILENLTQDNTELDNLVKASAEGAGPVKIKVRGYRQYESTENKVRSIQFDDLEIDAPAEVIKEYITDLKTLLGYG